MVTICIIVIHTYTIQIKYKQENREWAFKNMEC
jgi:hypothetical protein